MHIVSTDFGDEPAAEEAEIVESGVETTAEPETDTYGHQVKQEINMERAKAGLTEIPSEPQAEILPPRDNFAIGAISLLVIAFLLLSNS